MARIFGFRDIVATHVIRDNIVRSVCVCVIKIDIKPMEEVPSLSELPRLNVKEI